MGAKGAGGKTAEAPAQARRPSHPCEGVAPRQGAPPHAGRCASRACRLVAARRACLHATGRKSTGRATRPGLRERGARLPVPQDTRSPGEQGRSSPASVGCPRAAGAGGPHRAWPGAAPPPCSWAWQHTWVAGAGGPWGSLLARRGGWPAGSGRPRDPRRCPAQPGTAARWACPARRWVPEARSRRPGAVVEGGRGEVSPRRSPEPVPAPNKGLQLTASSLRSFLASAIGGA